MLQQVIYKSAIGFRFHIAAKWDGHVNFLVIYKYHVSGCHHFLLLYIFQIQYAEFSLKRVVFRKICTKKAGIIFLLCISDCHGQLHIFRLHHVKQTHLIHNPESQPCISFYNFKVFNCLCHSIFLSEKDKYFLSSRYCRIQQISLKHCVIGHRERHHNDIVLTTLRFMRG